MRRLTSLFTHVLPAALILTMFASPVQGQQAPQPARANTMRPMALPPGGLVAPVPAQGQATTPPAVAPRPETPRAPGISTPGNMPLGPVNIKLDLAITDNVGGTPVKKSVSLLILNGNNGMIRTSNSQANALLNVDAVASAYQNGAVSLRLTFEYVPALIKDSDGRASQAPRLNESITVVLQDGKPLMVSQSADPATDRKVTAELTATILK